MERQAPLLEFSRSRRIGRPIFTSVTVARAEAWSQKALLLITCVALFVLLKFSEAQPHHQTQRDYNLLLILIEHILWPTSLCMLDRKY